MRLLALMWMLCAALPAQQVHIFGVAEDPDGGSVRAAETDDNVVVTLPGVVAAAPFNVSAHPSSILPDPVAVPALPPPVQLSIPSDTVPAPSPAGSKHASRSYLPVEFERDSGFFCQKLIGAWKEEDAYNLLGTPVRRRPAFDSDQSINGQILAYSDPTGRYRQIELDFARDTGLLRTVFVYPWKMSWQECRRLWGAKVQSTEANKGRTFYSYVNRRIDVLVDAAGNVISLGLY